MNKYKNFIKKNIIKFKIFITIIIYITFFCKLGNTCYRINSNGDKTIRILPIITSGIFGPIKSSYLLIKNKEIKPFIKFIILQLNLLSNPLGAYLFTDYTIKLILNKCSKIKKFNIISYIVLTLIKNTNHIK